MQTGTPKYLTLKTAAERCSLSTKTLRRAISDGRLKAFAPEGVSSVLIAVDDLDAFIESTCVSGLNLDDILVGV
jgi:excisionase family DNA binding protein